MNRIEIVGLFTALKELCKQEDMEAVENVIDAVLKEALQKHTPPLNSRMALSFVI